MQNLQDWLVILPARLGSTRLPQKPLALLGGEALIVRVYERLEPLRQKGATVVVATDAAKIEAVLKARQIPYVLTNPNHPSGTDRVHEASLGYAQPNILNVQGDEPFIDIAALESLIKSASARPDFAMGTLVYKNYSATDYLNSNIVKCIRGPRDDALYFSRAPIPFVRDGFGSEDFFWQHLGVYAFRRESLARFCALGPSPLEMAERLEQLRALEAGIPILTCESKEKGLSIDTLEDLEAARAIYR